jgi:paraquat-inducible protein B
MSKKASSAAIGLFVLVALGLGVAALVLLGGGRLFHRTYAFVVYFRGSVSGLMAGAPVKFKGVEIGQVKQVYVMLTDVRAESPDVRIPVVISLDPTRIGSPGEQGTPTNLPPIDSFVDAGLRAQLATTSFVTNLRYVSLDVLPGSPKNLVNDSRVPYPEIPTLPNALENAEKQASEVLAQLSRLDIESVLRSAQRTLDGVERLVTSRELDETLRSIQRGAASFEETMRNLSATSASLRRLSDEVSPDVVAISKSVRRASEVVARTADGTEALLATMRGLVEPAGPAVFRFQQSLTEVSATARSLRHLIETVDRDPGILVRGGNP